MLINSYKLQPFFFLFWTALFLENNRSFEAFYEVYIKHSPAAVIVITWKKKWSGPFPPTTLACGRRRISDRGFSGTRLSGSCVVFVGGHAATDHDGCSRPDLNKQTKKQILVVTVVFCFVAFQTFFEGIKLRFICQARSQESLLLLEGSLSNDDGDGSKNVAKKVNWDPFKLNRVYLDPLNLFPLVDWKEKKEGSVRKPLVEKAYSCQPREHKSLLSQPITHVY